MRVGIALASVLLCAASAVPVRSDEIRWLPVWQAVPTLRAGVPDQVVRTTVDLSAGGSSVRVRLSNLMGIGPVRVEQVTVKAGGETRELTFRGSRAVTIRARGEVYSDAVALPVTKTLEISTHVPDGTPCQARAWNTVTSARAYICLVSAVEVAGFSAPGAVVALGDSITEGYAEGTWPALLESDHAVLNAGINGNGVVAGDAPMVTRLDRDVLFSPEVREVVLLGGINDIQRDVAAADVIAGIRAIRERCEKAGARFRVGTVTPWRGWPAWTEARERQRQEVNAWIRATFPDALDFDVALRDPADPLRLRPEFDAGDHLHPNADAFGVMARLVRG